MGTNETWLLRRIEEAKEKVEHYQILTKHFLLDSILHPALQNLAVFKNVDSESEANKHFLKKQWWESQLQSLQEDLEAWRKSRTDTAVLSWEIANAKPKDLKQSSLF